MRNFASTLRGLPVTDTQFVTTITIDDLNSLVIHARAFMSKAKNDPMTARLVEKYRVVHAGIQREMSGAKLSNARGDLKRYLIDEWLPDGGSGVFPPVVLWFPDQLEEDGLGNYAVPPGARGLLLDGESRDEAIQSIIEDPDVPYETVQQMAQRGVPVVVFHGIPADDAGKYFADMNSKGVVVNANFALARDIDDPWSQIALEVFSSLNIGIETDKRQVPRGGDKVLTAMAARTMTAATVFGVAAVQYGAKAMPKKVGGQPVDFDKVRQAAKTWFKFLFEGLGKDAFTDKDKVLRTVPVLVSLAALGQAFYSENLAKQAEVRAIVRDSRIDWTLDNAQYTWSGLAGKVNALGRFSAGSGKEAAYATFKAISDEDSPGGQQIRSLSPVTSAA